MAEVWEQEKQTVKQLLSEVLTYWSMEKANKCRYKEWRMNKFSRIKIEQGKDYKEAWERNDDRCNSWLIAAKDGMQGQAGSGLNWAVIYSLGALSKYLQPQLEASSYIYFRLLYTAVICLAIAID